MALMRRADLLRQQITAAALNSPAYTIINCESYAPRVFLCGGYRSPVYPLPCLIIKICLLCFSIAGTLSRTLRGLRPSTPQPFAKGWRKLYLVFFLLRLAFLLPYSMSSGGGCSIFSSLEIPFSCMVTPYITSASSIVPRRCVTVINCVVSVKFLR